MVSDSSQTQYFDFCSDGTDHFTSYHITLLHITFPILSHFKVLWIRADIFKNISGQKENVPFPLLSYFSQGLCSYAFTWFYQMDILSRRAVGTLSAWRLSSWWRVLQLVFVLTIKVLQLCRLPHNKVGTVVNVSQHRPVVLCVGGLH